jgi:uncharacterized membrane protein HdeD (DUF308 family)
MRATHDQVAENSRIAPLGTWPMADLTRKYQRKLNAQIAMTEDDWKLFLLQGAGLILLGLTAAILANVTALVIGAQVGWLLLISGLFRLGSGFGADIGPGHWSSMLLSALMILLGAVLAFYSKESVFELSVALAAYFAIHAIASLILASSLREETGTWLALIVGALVDVLFATLTFAQWPSRAPWVFGLYLGVDLAVAGLVLTFVALGVKSQMRRGQKSITRRDTASRHPSLHSARRKDNRHDQQTRL